MSAIIRGDEIKRYLRHLSPYVDPPEPEEAETEDKSLTLDWSFSRLLQQVITLIFVYYPSFFARKA